MADDALKCFTTLLDNMPGWIAELEGILKTVGARQQEALQENQPAGEQYDIPRKASKTSSMRSSWSGKERLTASPPGNAEITALQQQMPRMTASDALRLSQRKRKTTSACSAVESGPVKYRFTSAAVVYYDGDVQTRFDALVRGVASTRNCLRKGKMSAKVDMLSRSGSSSSSGDSSNDEALVKLRKAGYGAMRLRSRGLLGKRDGSEAFDKTDGSLEKAQALCERAAHQVLRDGDCTLEINTAKTHFEEAQRLCEASLPYIRKRAEKAESRRRREEERRQLAGAEEDEEDNDDEDAKSRSLEDIIVVDPLYNAAPTVEVDLEADDSDGGDGHDYNALMDAMKGGRYQMRSARLAAC